VTEADLAEQLKALDATLRNIEQVLDLPRMRKEKADLEEQASAPDLWDDQAKAQQVTSRLSYVGGELTRLEKLRTRLDDAGLMLEMAQSEEDAAALADVASEAVILRKAIDELEVRTLLSGEYDAREALVTIRSGAGGVDAADFAEMLLRMYLRWAERHGYGTDVYDTSYERQFQVEELGTLRTSAGARPQLQTEVDEAQHVVNVKIVFK